jgi:hypothetical protein
LCADSLKLILWCFVRWFLLLLVAKGTWNGIEIMKMGIEIVMG